MNINELTKEDLQKMGIVDVDFDNLIVYGKNGQLKYYKGKRDHLMVSLYELDENRNKIKIPKIVKYTRKDGSIRESNSYGYKTRLILLYKVLWVWRRDTVQKDHVIDHKAEHNTRRCNRLKSSKRYIKAKK